MNILLLFLVSTSGVNSLLLPASSYGMVTGFTSAKDVEAVFYNPANFSAREDYSLWLSYNQFYASMQSVSLALGKRLGKFDVGFFLLNFDFGDFELRPDYPTEDTVAYYSGNDFTAGLSANVSIPPFGSIGASVKYIYEQLYTYAGGTFAFDLAFSYRTEKAGITVGVTDFGQTIPIGNETVNLPASISLGALYDFKKVITTAEVHYLVNNEAWEGGVGAELPLNEAFGIMAALNYREKIYPGFGITLNAGKLQLRYAGAIYIKDLGLINSLGIGFDF